jgi:hypothetical protein
MKAMKEIVDVDFENAKIAMRAKYMCGDCAENLGGRWPRGHRATFHPAICPICKHTRAVASWDDWNWPKAKAADAHAKRSREY